MTDREIVCALLATAGISPAEAEIEGLVAVYPMVRQMVESLYAVEAARYEDTALVFDAAPPLGDW